MSSLGRKRFFVNGVETNVFTQPDTTLADVLREQLHLTGTKVGCGEGRCGACSVILNGKVVRSCITKMKRVPDYAHVTTIEGIGKFGDMHPLQKAWALVCADSKEEAEAAAKDLGVSRVTLYAHIRRHGISLDSFRRG